MKQVRRSCQGSGGSFATPEHGGVVLPKGHACGFADLEGLGEEMGNDASQLKVGVRYGPSRVRERDEFALDRQREGLAPEDRSVAVGC
jgi:hypothetical protein